MSVPELSIVIPCYNEEENVEAICAAVNAEAEKYVRSHEIILIDNYSTDGTRELIQDLCSKDKRIRAIFNNANYGQMRSPTHAIYQTRGKAVIGMCADFQDPPALIGEMIRIWRTGAKIVLGQRRSERTSPIMTMLRNAGYNLLRKVSDHPVLSNVTGFGLYDREVVDLLATWKEPEPFFRGMLVESGYPITLIAFDRPGRAAGKTKNNVYSLISFALSGIAASARSLLRMPILLSVWIALAAALLVCAAIVAAIVGSAVSPWLITSLVTALFAVLFFFLGLIGDQVRLLAERARNVPLVVEERRINFGADNQT